MEPTKETQSLQADESAARWDDYTLNALSERHPVAWLSDHWAFQLPLYWKIMRLVPPGGRVLEIGCGAGPHMLWLAARGYATVGVEYRPKLVDAARKLANQFELDSSFEVGNAFDLAAFRDFDLVFSLGMVEHWTREQTVRALREQAACATKVIAMVPTPHTHYAAPITDERFYSRREFRQLFIEAGLRDVESIGYGPVPSRTGRTMDLVLPRGVLRVLRRDPRFAMAQGALGHAD